MDCRDVEYLQDNTQIIVHGFRHAGVFDALGILDDDELPDYMNDEDSDLDEDSVDEYRDDDNDDGNTYM